jgi:serine/threonine protein kinase
MKDNNIVHTNMTLANIKIDAQMCIKISEFSECIQLSDPDGYSMVRQGSKEVMAPEMVQSIGYSFDVDLWALGILIFTLYFGYNPFINAPDAEKRL